MFSRNLYRICSSTYRQSRVVPHLQKICVGTDASHKTIIRNCSSNRHIVQIRGLDFEVKEQDVVDFFKSLNISPIRVDLKCDGSGRISGVGVSEVEFASHAEAVVAMRKRNAFMGNRFIRLTLKSSEVEDPSRKKAVNEQPDTLSKIGLTLEGNIDRTSFPTGHFVRMKNIPSRTTDQAIYQFFTPVGILPIGVKQIYDESGHRIGEVEVEFLSHKDAVVAMTKNNSYLGNKFVELFLNSAPNAAPRDEMGNNEVNILGNADVQKENSSSESHANP